LEVDERGIALRIEHDVACLEVAIHEGSSRDADDVSGHLPERLFEFQFVEVDAGGFQEAIFEIVEVEEDIRLVESFLRIALREIEALRSENLQGGKGGNGSP